MSVSRRIGFGALALFAGALISGRVQAQKPPRLGYVFPPSIRAGATTEVQLGGYDFTPDMQWFIHDPLAKLTTSGTPGDYQLTPPPYWTGPRAGVGSPPIAREVTGRIAIDPARPDGLVRWQVANANGASQTAVFYVGRGQEIVENRSRDLPQRLPALPVAVSGRLSRLTEVDRYEVVADADGLISVDLMARRLGSGFNGTIEVRDASGEVLADFADTQGLDGGLTFAARSGKTYEIALHDADFQGDRAFVYRLAVTRGPRVLATLPSQGRRGASMDVEFVGVGVQSGKPVLESARQTVVFPADAGLASHSHTLKTPFGDVDVSIPLGDLDEQSRVEQGLVRAPLAITNIMPPEIDQQRFSWNVAKDEYWKIDLQSRGIGGRLDVGLTIVDPEGKPVAESDDLPGTTDAGLEFRSGLGGPYTCLVRSLASRLATLDEVYRLEIRRAEPDFSLTLPQQIPLPLGGNGEIAVAVTRSGGFDGEIVLAAEGLPPGVSATGEWKVPAGKNEAKVTLKSAPDAAVVAAPIRVRGTGKIGETSKARLATAVAAGNLAPRSPSEQMIDVALLVMTMTPPFDVKLIDKTRQREVHRGSTCLAEIDIVRKEGFSGEVRLEMAATQSRYLCGSRGLGAVVPANVTRVTFPTWMSEWLGTEFTMRMATQGVAVVPDPKGTPRYLTKPADAAITMIMEGALLKLTAHAADSVVPLGGTFEIPVSISRSAKLPNSTTVTLEIPVEAAGLIKAEPLVLPTGQDHGVLKVTTVNNDRLNGSWTFRLRAHALQDERWPVISETELPVMFTTPLTPNGSP